MPTDIHAAERAERAEEPQQPLPAEDEQRSHGDDDHAGTEVDLDGNVVPK